MLNIGKRFSIISFFVFVFFFFSISQSLILLSSDDLLSDIFKTLIDKNQWKIGHFRYITIQHDSESSSSRTQTKKMNKHGSSFSLCPPRLPIMLNFNVIFRKWPIECFHMTSRRPYWRPKTMKRRPCWCPKPVL